MNKQMKKKGFTLVELIVVLVILAVLIALLVPALTGYINKAKEKSAVSECRMTVEAAQTIISEKYGESSFADLALDPASINPDVIELSETKGEIAGSVRYDEHGKVTYLEYISPKNITVIYDINHNPNYYISTASSKVYGFISDSNEIAKKLGGGGRETIISEVEGKFGGLLKVDSYYTGRTENYKGKSLFWRPYYLKDNSEYSTFLFANTSDTGHSQWRANLIYINGNLYESSTFVGISDIYKLNPADAEAWLKNQPGVTLCK